MYTRFTSKSESLCSHRKSSCKMVCLRAESGGVLRYQQQSSCRSAEVTRKPKHVLCTAEVPTRAMYTLWRYRQKTCICKDGPAQQKEICSKYRATDLTLTAEVPTPCRRTGLTVASAHYSVRRTETRTTDMLCSMTPQVCCSEDSIPEVKAKLPAPRRKLDLGISSAHCWGSHTGRGAAAAVWHSCPQCTRAAGAAGHLSMRSARSGESRRCRLASAQGA